MSENLLFAIIAICITVLIILFAGTPDLADAIMNWISPGILQVGTSTK